MEKPVISKKEPIAVELKAGETYYWCSCGRSTNQPFCDGSHKGTSYEPMAFTPDNKETAYLCACKHTKKPPFCDGTHDDLK